MLPTCCCMLSLFLLRHLKIANFVLNVLVAWGETSSPICHTELKCCFFVEINLICVSFCVNISLKSNELSLNWNSLAVQNGEQGATVAPHGNFFVVKKKKTDSRWRRSSKNLTLTLMSSWNASFWDANLTCWVLVNFHVWSNKFEKPKNGEFSL